MSLSKRTFRPARPRLASRIVAPMALCVITLFGSPLWAASLTGPVSGWASSGTSWVSGSGPSVISMYVYIPDKVVTNPPLLLLLPYCGGNAAGVFGEAQGGGIVSAADMYGFIMVVPQTTNPSGCWDVSSMATQTRDGKSDTQAIAEIVKFAITKYSANTNRVYVTGTSSGATMTELMIGLYPEMFKAGAEFAGTPAGCTNIFDGTGKCGQPTMLTGQQWGDKVRAMDPGYSGFRPRIQLWHGTADTTLVYADQTNAIAEWINVLGLSTTATSTKMVLFTGHQKASPPTTGWTDEQWQNSCGYTVLDAWSETDGPHGTDANFNAQYTIPFLALDKTGPVDPEVAACSADAGSGSSSGSDASSSGGSTGSSGSSSGTGGSSGSGSTTSSSGGSSSGAAGSSSGPSDDAGGATGGSSGDAGQSVTPPAGCSCDVPGASGTEGVFAWAGVVALNLIRSGRRRARPSARRKLTSSSSTTG